SPLFAGIFPVSNRDQPLFSHQPSESPPSSEALSNFTPRFTHSAASHDRPLFSHQSSEVHYPFALTQLREAVKERDVDVALVGVIKRISNYQQVIERDDYNIKKTSDAASSSDNDELKRCFSAATMLPSDQGQSLDSSTIMMNGVIP
ncbi:hypothetical protein V2J09_009136, partial [Rumex salicifolius]